MKITKKDVKAMFARFNKALGKKEAESFKDVGSLILEHNSTYGGYKIEEVLSESGGITHPFCDARLSSREMYYALYFACMALDYKERNQHVRDSNT